MSIKIDRNGVTSIVVSCAIDPRDYVEICELDHDSCHLEVAEVIEHQGSVINKTAIRMSKDDARELARALLEWTGEY